MGEPPIVVRHGPGSLSAFETIAAVGGRPLVWLVDRSDPGAIDHRALRRFGTVVDVTGAGAGEVARRVERLRPTGVVTFFDTGMVSLAEVAGLAGLPFHSPDTARALVDKHVQRAVLRAGGLPMPSSRLIDPDAPVDWDRLDAEIAWPAVLKPVQGSGSRHVVKVSSSDEVRRAVDSVAGGGRFVLEEYLADGPVLVEPNFAPFVSVESVVSGGVVSHAAISGKLVLAEPFRETGSFMPAAIPPGIEADVLATVERAVAALGVTTGCLHTEVKLTPYGPRVIEVNGRLGGAVPGMMRRASGLDLFDVAVRLAEGEQVLVPGPLRSEEVTYFLTVQPPQVRAELEALIGVDRVAMFPGVEHVAPQKAPGDLVDWTIGTRSVLVEVTGKARSYRALARLEEAVRDEIRAVFRPERSEPRDAPAGAAHTVPSR